MLEDVAGSTVAEFLEMIEAGGGEFVSSQIEYDVRGAPTGNYFVISRW